jgi:hypothetical protein
MKPLAAIRTDGTERAGLLRSESRLLGRSGRRPTPNYRLWASQEFAENDAKDSRGDSYAITSGISKPNIYHNNHYFAQGPIRPGLPRQEPRRLLSAGRRAMKANFSFSQPTSGRARRQACAFRNGFSKSAFSLDTPRARIVEGGSCKG